MTARIGIVTKSLTMKTVSLLGPVCTLMSVQEGWKLGDHETSEQASPMMGAMVVHFGDMAEPFHPNHSIPLYIRM